MRVIIKRGRELTPKELDEINQANFREFKVDLLPQEYIERAIFFILLENEHLLAKGEMTEIKPVIFQGEKFSIMGLGGIVSIEKNRGFGRLILDKMTAYLTEKDKTGVGFCGNDNQGFYEKCGYKTHTSLSTRFVCYQNNEKIIGEDDEVVLYKDGSDKFIEKVLADPDHEVVFSQPPNW